MKCKVTKKSIKANYSRIIGIGYCNAQHLLNYETPFAYSSNNNGWSCDYYDIAGVCVSTGYNPMGDRVNYETLTRYEKQAEAIQYNNALTYEEKKLANRELIQEMLGV